ncbi:MAG: transketolase C-terminal domain-containing protein [Oscillospiraceae bacterium]|nr:transketolase C-terminal domain-containing protein [Oscillospiraceae bacterium]
MVKLVKEHIPDMVEMRAAYCGTLAEAARADSRIVALNCDLCSSMGLKPFAAEFPQRAINVGIQEANACSMAGGMSAAGMIPFFHTFAVFATRRVYDQIFMCCAYPKLNVKIVGGDAGVSGTYNGGTHMAFEDVGILRVMPNVTILEPSDAVMMKSLVRQMAQTYGVQYLRTPRKQMVKIYEESSEFSIGKAAVLREGGDVTIIAYGMTVIESLKAAELLAREGIQARVVDMFTIKPVDRECIIESAEKTGCIVTAENHQVIGGVGSAVAEVLVENCPVPMERVGIKDEFGEVGTQDYLMKRFGLTAKEITAAAKRTVARK